MFDNSFYNFLGDWNEEDHAFWNLYAYSGGRSKFNQSLVSLYSFGQHHIIVQVCHAGASRSLESMARIRLHRVDRYLFLTINIPAVISGIIVQFVSNRCGEVSPCTSSPSLNQLTLGSCE